MPSTILLLNEVDKNGVGMEFPRPDDVWNYQARLTGTGPVSATVTVEVSNGAGWQLFGTMTMTGNDEVIDNISGDMPWTTHRARVSGLTGTNAKVSLAGRGE